MDKITIITPASTSNLGPGFDTLGLALDWPLATEARRIKSGLELRLSFPGRRRWEAPLKELVRDALRAWADRTGKRAPGLALAMTGTIPLARGLGSSAVYRLSAVMAANVLSGSPLTRGQALDLVCRIEGHPDNAAACLAGGLVVAGWDRNRVRYVRYPVPDRFRFAVLVPRRELATEKARAVLPEAVPRADAVFNLQRALWLVDALVRDRPGRLRGALADRLHQPFRQRLLPGLSTVIAAAEKAGAYGAFLSGAGSSIIAITDSERAQTVKTALAQAAAGCGLQGSVKVLKPDNRGLRILDPRPGK